VRGCEGGITLVMETVIICVFRGSGEQALNCSSHWI
jgi:hypothetical protein